MSSFFYISSKNYPKNVIKYEGKRIILPFQVKEDLSYVGKWNFFIIKDSLILFDKNIRFFLFLDKFDKKEINVIFAFGEEESKNFMKIECWDDTTNSFIDIKKIYFENHDVDASIYFLKKTIIDEDLSFYRKLNEIDKKDNRFLTADFIKLLINEIIKGKNKNERFLEDPLIWSLEKVAPLKHLAERRKSSGINNKKIF